MKKTPTTSTDGYLAQKCMTVYKHN